jgi:hypothetical protein
MACRVERAKQLLQGGRTCPWRTSPPAPASGRPTARPCHSTVRARPDHHPGLPLRTVSCPPAVPRPPHAPRRWGLSRPPDGTTRPRRGGPVAPARSCEAGSGLLSRPSPDAKVLSRCDTRHYCHSAQEGPDQQGVVSRKSVNKRSTLLRHFSGLRSRSLAKARLSWGLQLRLLSRLPLAGPPARGRLSAECFLQGAAGRVHRAALPVNLEQRPGLPDCQQPRREVQPLDPDEPQRGPTSTAARGQTTVAPPSDEKRSRRKKP